MEDTDSIKPDLDASLDSLNNTIDNDDQSSITSSTKRRINRLPINTKDRRSCRRRDKNAEKLKPGRKSVEELREKFSNQLLEIWKTAKDLKVFYFFFFKSFFFNRFLIVRFVKISWSFQVQMIILIIIKL